MEQSTAWVWCSERTLANLRWVSEIVGLPRIFCLLQKFGKAVLSGLRTESRSRRRTRSSVWRRHWKTLSQVCQWMCLGSSNQHAIVCSALLFCHVHVHFICYKVCTYPRLHSSRFAFHCRVFQVLCDTKLSRENWWKPWKWRGRINFVGEETISLSILAFPRADKTVLSICLLFLRKWLWDQRQSSVCYLGAAPSL